MKSQALGKTLILIDATASLSGGRVYLQNLLKALANQPTNYRYLIYHTSDLNISSLADFPADFDFRRVRLASFLTHHWLMGSILKLFWRSFVLPFYLWREKPAIFFSNAAQAPKWKPGATKAIVALHNSIPYQPELWRVEQSRLRRWRLVMLRGLARGLVGKGLHFIVFSEDLRQRILKMGGTTDHSSVVYHGIEWGEKERIEKTSEGELSKLGVAAPYLLYVSQLHRYKNVLSLLESFAKVKQLQSSLSLVIVGSIADRHYGQEIDQTIQRLNLNDVVRVIPGIDRPRLIGLYRESRGIVYPSLAENCPLALLESMAMGKPIAASRIGAIEEICGDAAIYFDPHRPEEIVTAMRRLVEDESLRSDLSLRAIARARQFSWEETARRTLEVFERVARQS